jgi:uncharacterized protein YukE
MAITGNIESNFVRRNYDFKTPIKTAQESVNAIVGAKQSAATFEGAQSAGMNYDEIIVFDQAIEKYKESAQSILQKFNVQQEKVRLAAKGETETAIATFLQEMHQLLNKYIESIDIEKKLIHEANEKYLAEIEGVAKSIESSAEHISSVNSTIKLD